MTEDDCADHRRGGLLGELAGELWAGHEFADQFPRRIEEVAPLRLPLVFIHLPVVSVELIRRWASDRRIAAMTPADDRELMGCCVCHRGFGYVFICSNDLKAERRLTAAHETAHFLLDYLLPRRQVLAALGESATPVLDGLRPPTVAGRARALLSHVHLGPHLHLFPRRGLNEDDDVQVAATEARVDALAMELVAPRHRVAQQLAQVGTSPSAATLLGDYFGLPPYVFGRAIRSLQPRPLPRVLELARNAARQRRESDPS